MAGHVTNLATKFEHPMPIRFWFMSCNVSLWLPSRMRTRPLSMRRITWPVSRGQKQLHFWNSRPRFAYSLYNFPWATTTGRLLTNAKALDCVIFCAWLCDLDLLIFNSYHAWRVTWPTLPPSLKILWLCVHELRVITFPIDYHWKCVRGHCACAESRDPWVGGQKQLHFWNLRPRFAYSLYNFYWVTTTIKGRLLSSRPM